MTEFSNFLLQIESQRCGSKKFRWFSIIFVLNYDVFKSKSPCFLLNKNINFINETESKMENPTHIDWWIFPFSSYRNRRLKIKLWWVWVRKRKKSAFFVDYFVQRKFFFNICVLSECIVYWINIQNRYTFTYQKILLHTLLLLVPGYTPVLNF